ncbi:hypothetical protein M5E87_06875 [Flavonifractor plautii]|nr:hypothetical protein M5E87_06875 [Flavonifractor plautii]
MPPAGLYGGVHSPAHHSQNPADPGGPGSADGRAARPGELVTPWPPRATPAASRWRAWASSPCGGILDFFSPAHPKPVRVEFFGDEIDAMGLFDPDTQRRIENLGAAEILPRRRCCPSLPLAGTAGCWRGWTVSFPRQSAARGARHWCRRWRRTGSGCRPVRPSRPWTATSP